MKKYWKLIMALGVVAAGCSDKDADEPTPIVTPQDPDDDDNQGDNEGDGDENNGDEGDENTKEMKYRVAQLSIDTGGAAISTKTEYVPCTVTIDADGEEWDYEGTAGIRGRGNSSWEWYPKKPYRIKLDKKAELMGMGSGKSWVLLANYRDPTDLMNTFVFELGELAGLQYTNHTRYVEVTLNGEYIGLYQLTEQVQQGKGRVNIDEKEGYLLSLDRDDGPELAPEETDNFWSEVYRMPVCVKNPDEPSAEVLAEAKSELAILERAIKAKDYELVKTLLDVESFIDYVMIQEMVYNVELDAPRSMFMYRDKDEEQWHMGPLWDFDAGYDFDWSNMYTGHTFFTNHKELVLGTNPYTHAGTSYEVPGFFSDLFGVEEFVSDYKTRWKHMRDYVLQAWEASKLYVDDDVWQREQDTWPISKTYSTELNRMQNWINNRRVYLDSVIDGY
ncbi:MAG: CotH kinase family protein [Bacteroidales bacterium]|nr:CotH kinase family protein [Bacteroidales bacterium]